jgi:hypothetical protein
VLDTTGQPNEAIALLKDAANHFQSKLPANNWRLWFLRAELARREKGKEELIERKATLSQAAAIIESAWGTKDQRYQRVKSYVD